MSYIQVANFVNYTETDVASLIRKAGKNPAKICTNFLPHIEKFPTGEMNLHLVHKELAEKLGGPEYMERLEKDPGYIWEKLQENTQLVMFAKDNKISNARLPISVIIENTSNVSFEDMEPGFIKNKYLGIYRKSKPFKSSHSQEHAMESRLDMEEL